MLVWSPNHCVSDAKREWVGKTRAPGRAEVCRGSPPPFLVWAPLLIPSYDLLQWTSTSPWPRRNTAITLSRWARLQPCGGLGAWRGGAEAQASGA